METEYKEKRDVNSSITDYPACPFYGQNFTYIIPGHEKNSCALMMDIKENSCIFTDNSYALPKIEIINEKDAGVGCDINTCENKRKLMKYLEKIVDTIEEDDYSNF